MLCVAPLLWPLVLLPNDEWSRGYKDGYSQGYSQGYAQGYGQAHLDGRNRMTKTHVEKLKDAKNKANPRIVTVGPNGMSIDVEPKQANVAGSAVVVYGPEGQEGPFWLLVEGEKRRVFIVPDEMRQPVARLLAGDHVRFHGGFEQWKEVAEPNLREALLKLNWRGSLSHERFPVVGTAYVFALNLMAP